MAQFETLPIVMGLGGIVLVYGAVKNRNPADVIKLALQGKDIAGAKPMSTGGAGGSDGGKEASQQGPNSVDSLDAGDYVNDVLGKVGIDGRLVIIPYRGHPVGSHTYDADVPGFMGGVAGKNSTYPQGSAGYDRIPVRDGSRGGSGHF